MLPGGVAEQAHTAPPEPETVPPAPETAAPAPQTAAGAAYRCGLAARVATTSGSEA